MAIVSPTLIYVGQKGFFEFHSPFDTAYHLNDLFLVVDHVSAINTLILDNVNIEDKYFKPYGLSKTQYIAFLKDSGVIVTFKSRNGDRYSVPNTFIKALPNPNDIPYRQLGINVAFGPLPLNYDLEALKDQISRAVYNVLGVKATINFAPLSPVVLMPQTSPPNVPQYYNATHVALNNLELMISAVQSVGNDYQTLKAQLTGNANNTIYNGPGLGLFAGGDGISSSSNTNIYTFADGSVFTGSNLAYGVYALAGAGNTNVGVFGGGFTGGTNKGMLSTTCLYNYGINNAIYGGNLTYSGSYLAATGNSTIGVFGGGGSAPQPSLSVTSIYTYSSNTSIIGENLTYIANDLAATGNSTIGVFGGGLSDINRLSTTSIYTYANNSTVAGLNLTYSSYLLSATGNSTIGVFGGGNYYNILSTMSIYTYSSNSTSQGNNLTYNAYALAAASNSVIGVFGGGSDVARLSNTSVYAYSNNTTTVGTNLTYQVSSLAATSSNNVGVIN
jgi:ribosomal protein L30E